MRDRVAAAHTLSTMTTILSTCLHEPEARARRLARAAIANAERWHHETLRCVARLERGRSHGIVPTLPEARRLGAFARYVQDERAPKVLIGCHVGSFLVVLLKMLDAVAPGTRVLAPIPARSAAVLHVLVTYAAAQRKTLELVPLKTGLVAKLMRNRWDVVVLLADLGAAYGRVADVTFLDLPCKLVSGPYQMARLLHGSLLFFWDGPEDGFHTDQPDDTFEAESAATIAALAQCYARRMQRVIAAEPARWGRWLQLPELTIPGANPHVVAPDRGR